MHHLFDTRHENCVLTVLREQEQRGPLVDVKPALTLDNIFYIQSSQVLLTKVGF